MREAKGRQRGEDVISSQRLNEVSGVGGPKVNSLLRKREEGGSVSLFMLALILVFNSLLSGYTNMLYITKYQLKR